MLMIYVFKCLKVLQSFEPDGIGSRNVNECLWNQIDHYGLDDPDDERFKSLLSIIGCYFNKEYDSIKSHYN